jgi:hypothetical protein
MSNSLLPCQRLVIESHYFPCVEYISLLWQVPKVHIDTHDRYQKQSYRNRCRILGANNIEKLIVPIQHLGRPFTTAEARIDYSMAWQKQHLKTLQSAYGKAPFYEYYEQDLLAPLRVPYEYLLDLNKDILKNCLQALDYAGQVVYGHVKAADTTVATNFQNYIHPKKKSHWQSLFNPVPYQQVFGDGFVSNLSVLDLIFCEGPGAKSTIQKSMPGHERLFE